MICHLKPVGSSTCEDYVKISVFLITAWEAVGCLHRVRLCMKVSFGEECDRVWWGPVCPGECEPMCHVYVCENQV